MRMYRRVLMALVFALPLASGAAQEGGGEPKPKVIPATPLLLPKGAEQEAKPQEQPKSPAEAKYQELVEAYTKKLVEFRNKFTAAKPEERDALRSEAPTPDETAEALMTLAGENPKTPAAAKALIWVYQNMQRSKSDLSGRALEKIKADHLRSPEMLPLARGLGRADRGTAIPLLEEMSKQSESRDVRAFASFSLAQQLTGEGASDEERSRGEALYETIAKEFGDVAYAPPRPTTLAQKAEAALFEARHLKVGVEAPEIEGNDTDGVAFKLSDYRGKVVLLDFWGHW